MEEEKENRLEAFSILASRIESDMEDTKKIWDYIKYDNNRYYCSMDNFISGSKELGLNIERAPSLIFSYIKYLENQLEKLPKGVE